VGGLLCSPLVYTSAMKIISKICLIAASILLLTACATPSEPVINDGVAEAPPVGTNVKNRSGYKRGGSSSSVKVLTREQLNEEGVTADDILKPD
jgi:uncharacterized lipoprotein YajG